MEVSSIVSTILKIASKNITLDTYTGVLDDRYGEKNLAFRSKLKVGKQPNKQ